MSKRGIAAAVALLWVSAAQAQQAKTMKDQEEFAIYNEVIKDINTNNFAKALVDLNSWSQKYPETEYKQDRAAFYVQGYAATNEPGKAVDAAREVLGKDLAAVFPGPAGQAVVIRLLYNTAWAITRVAEPTAEQLATGERAARQLMEYDHALPGVTPAQWAEARKDMQEKAKTALLAMAMLPGRQAMAKQDCAAASAAYQKALTGFPERADLAYELARAYACEAKGTPEKLPLAIYEFQRAAVLDATLGDPSNDPKKIQTFADNSYVKLHGSDEGLAQLKQLVRQSPLPPAGFSIKSAVEIQQEKQAELERSQPQLALWLKIREALAAGGEQYFETQLKDAKVPPLEGSLVEARPACNPTTLLVAMEKGKGAEVSIKLEKAIAGKAEAGAEIRWEGVPTAFAKEPFLLTMESSSVQGLKTTPCGVKKR